MPNYAVPAPDDSQETTSSYSVPAPDDANNSQNPNSGHVQRYQLWNGENTVWRPKDKAVWIDPKDTNDETLKERVPKAGWYKESGRTPEGDKGYIDPGKKMPDTPESKPGFWKSQLYPKGWNTEEHGIAANIVEPVLAGGTGLVNGAIVSPLQGLSQGAYNALGYGIEGAGKVVGSQVLKNAGQGLRSGINQAVGEQEEAINQTFGPSSVGDMAGVMLPGSVAGKVMGKSAEIFGNAISSARPAVNAAIESAGAGTAAGIMEPTGVGENESFAGNKFKQMTEGAATGLALHGVSEGISNVINTTGRVKTAIGEAIKNPRELGTSNDKFPMGPETAIADSLTSKQANVRAKSSELYKNAIHGEEGKKVVDLGPHLQDVEEMKQKVLDGTLPNKKSIASELKAYKKAVSSGSPTSENLYETSKALGQGERKSWASNQEGQGGSSSGLDAIRQMELKKSLDKQLDLAHSDNPEYQKFKDYREGVEDPLANSKADQSNEELGIPGTREATKNWQENVAPWQSKYGKILNNISKSPDPTKAVNGLMNSDHVMANNIYGMLDDNGREAMKTKFIQDVIRKATGEGGNVSDALKLMESRKPISDVFFHGDDQAVVDGMKKMLNTSRTMGVGAGIAVPAAIEGISHALGVNLHAEAAGGLVGLGLSKYRNMLQGKAIDALSGDRATAFFRSLAKTDPENAGKIVKDAMSEGVSKLRSSITNQLTGIKNTSEKLKVMGEYNKKYAQMFKNNGLKTIEMSEIKGGSNAIQKQIPSSILQHSQEGAGKAGSGRGGVEQVEQGKEVAQKGEGKEEKIKFKPNENDLDEDSIPFKADISKIDKSWSKNKDFYIGENGGESKGKYDRFKQWINDNPNKNPDSPILAINEDGNIDFTNGRHRFAVARDYGQKTADVIIPKSQLNEFKNKFSAMEEQPKSITPGDQAIERVSKNPQTIHVENAKLTSKGIKRISQEEVDKYKGDNGEDATIHTKTPEMKKFYDKLDSATDSMTREGEAIAKSFKEGRNVTTQKMHDGRTAHIDDNGDGNISVMLSGDKNNIFQIQAKGGETPTLNEVVGNRNSKNSSDTMKSIAEIAKQHSPDAKHINMLVSSEDMLHVISKYPSTKIDSGMQATISLDDLLNKNTTHAHYGTAKAAWHFFDNNNYQLGQKLFDLSRKGR